MTKQVEILLFEGFDELDAVGPFEVLTEGADAGADLSVSMVAHGGEDRVTASHGLTVVPDDRLGQPDVLVVPGGGWTTEGGVRAVVEAGTLPGAVADRHAAGAVVASVCTGAMVLAAGGLLDGRPATTHDVAAADLDAVAERVDARVVDDGDVLTAGGVTSGIDLALHLLDRTAGPAVAEKVATGIAYDRRGPIHVSDG